MNVSTSQHAQAEHSAWHNNESRSRAPGAPDDQDRAREAVRRGHLARNPAEMAKTPPVNDYDVEPYTVDELQQLFVTAQQEPNGVRWVFALALGLRQGEALGPSVG